MTELNPSPTAGLFKCHLLSEAVPGHLILKYNYPPGSLCSSQPFTPTPDTYLLCLLGLYYHWKDHTLYLFLYCL